jgi:hypothetical protein
MIEGGKTMAATFINVQNIENQTLTSRYLSTKDGRSKNTVHVHSALSSVIPKSVL